MFYLPSKAIYRGNETITVNRRSVTTVKYSYKGESFVAKSVNETIALPITYTFYVSYEFPNFLDRIAYTFVLPTGSSVSVQYDFWLSNVMRYSSAILPDVSCKKACIESTTFSVRSIPAAMYPTNCSMTTEEKSRCVCLNTTTSNNPPTASSNSTIYRPFCNISYPVSSLIDANVSDRYAYLMRNLTVINQPPPGVMADCITEMTNFLCAFYLPPCTRYNTRVRPTIRSFLSCFRDNPLFFTSDIQTSLLKSEVATLWGNSYGSELAQDDINLITQQSEIEKRELQTSWGPITFPISPDSIPPAGPESAPVVVPLEAPALTTQPVEAHPVLIIPVDPSEPQATVNPQTEEPTNTTEPSLEPSFEPLISPDIAPSNDTQPDSPVIAPTSTVPTSAPVTAPVPHAPPVHPPTPHSVPLEPVTPPSVPIIMSNQSIDYATAYSIFSVYDVVAHKSVAYPDLYTLKNWQIALMLFGSIGLLLTIVISCVMVHRRVANHYEKV